MGPRRLLVIGWLALGLIAPAGADVWFEGRATNPIIRPGFGGELDAGAALDPDLHLVNGEFWLYYTAVDSEGHRRIALATSTDSLDWTPHGVVTEPDPGGFDGGAAGDPAVIVDGAGFHLYYTTGNASIGLAHSADGRWFGPAGREEVLTASGVPGSFDELGVREPAVAFHEGGYVLMYTGDEDGVWSRLGLAVSSDGRFFQRISGNEGLGANFGRGPHGFDDGGALEPALAVGPEGPRLFYTSLHY